MTAAATDTYEADAEPPGICWDCGGPCLTYKGSVHGWRCTACVDRYLDAGAAKAEARERARQARKVRAAWDQPSDAQTPVTANSQRRDGGAPSYVPTAVPALALIP